MNDNVNDIDYQNKPRNNGKVFVGMVLLVIGGILLLRQFDFFDVPGWIWSWPTWVLVWAMYSGSKHNFRNATWFILLFIGLAGLLNEAVPTLHLAGLIWPAAIIMFGVWIIMKRNHTWERGKWEKKWDRWDKNWEQNWAQGNPPASTGGGTPEDMSSTAVPSENPNPRSFTADDFLDATSIFGGAKKTVLSKNFRGGDVTNIFGGCELDLTMADITGKVVIDITQVFGGTKIIVPPHWQVISNLSSVFAGVDDKRLRQTGSGDNNKILVLEGVSIFAGVEIRSF